MTLTWWRRKEAEMGRRKRETEGGKLPEIFEFDEHALAEAVGLRRTLIRDARRMMKAGWSLVHGCVLYSREGVEEMLGLIPLTLDEVRMERTLERCRVTETWNRKMAGCRRASVVAYANNYRFVYAVLLDDEQQRRISVEVGNQALFVHGMEMPVRKTGPDSWELGCRRPRMVGVW